MTHFSQLVIDTVLDGYVWQELQVMHRWFQLFPSNFDTSIDNVLTPHLTEPAPYMGLQVPTSVQAHSASGRTLLNITICHPDSPRGIKIMFHSSSSLTTCKMTDTQVPVPDFLSYLCTRAYFIGLSLQ